MLERHESANESRSAECVAQRRRRRLHLVGVMLRWLSDAHHMGLFRSGGRYSTGGAAERLPGRESHSVCVPDRLGVARAARTHCDRPGSLQGCSWAPCSALVVVRAAGCCSISCCGTCRVFAAAAELIRDKIAGFGIDSVWKYALLAVFYSLFHSLLEEYYWRWFVFRQLRHLCRCGRRSSFPPWLHGPPRDRAARILRASADAGLAACRWLWPWAACFGHGSTSAPARSWALAEPFADRRRHLLDRLRSGPRQNLH